MNLFFSPCFSPPKIETSDMHTNQHRNPHLLHTTPREHNTPRNVHNGSHFESILDASILINSVKNVKTRDLSLTTRSLQISTVLCGDTNSMCCVRPTSRRVGGFLFFCLWARNRVQSTCPTKSSKFNDIVFFTLHALRPDSFVHQLLQVCFSVSDFAFVFLF